ncbi:hypothetical protein LCGC14_2433450, partial [marine sediment metagenome]
KSTIIKAPVAVGLEEKHLKPLHMNDLLHEAKEALSAARDEAKKIVAAAQEERFTRKKHDTSFPLNSIKYCLANQNISIEDIDYITFYEKPLLKFERLLYQHLQGFPKTIKIFIRSMPFWLTHKLRIAKVVKKELGYKKDIIFIEHHMTHAASFLISPFEEAAIVTIDGVGEWTTTTYGVGKGNEIRLIKEIKFPSSLGLLYSTITAYLGFKVNNSEYKVMGLSPYGDMNRKTNIYYEKLRKVLDLKNDGSFRMNMDYFIYQFYDRMPSKKLRKLLGGPTRKFNSEITQRHKDIAAALQMLYEDVFIKILNHAYKETKCKNLVLSGGSALNSVANGKILSNTPFKKIWIQPDPGDGGSSIGGAVFLYNSILGNKRIFELKDASLGPEFSTKEVKNFLNKNKIKYQSFKNNEELVKKVAKLIREGNVMGWFQGRMEWGPRALGNRSILSDACNPKMRDILNLKVKHREKFRPFAPVICEDDVLEYFICDKPVPKPTDFMLMVYPIKKQWWKKIPSVTHVDGSGR